MGSNSSCTSGKCCSSGGSGGPGNKVFISHCKRTDSSEDRAIWVADTLDSAGFKAWFDRSDLQEITMDKLKEAVESSHCLITILDPFTFESPWVVKENEWARDLGIPILILYDGDRYRWEQVAKWQLKFPQCFKYPALEYVKNYRTESRNKVIAAVHERICEWSSSPQKPTVSLEQGTVDMVHESNAAAGEATPGGRGATIKGKGNTLRINTAADISVAVGSSSNAKLAKAVEGACSKLVQKLNAQPTFVVACVSCPLAPVEKAMEMEKVKQIIEKTFPGVPYVGGTSCMGIMVDSNWASPQNNAVALWGVNDPSGVYEVVHADYGKSSDGSSFHNAFGQMPIPVLSKEKVDANIEIAFEAGAKAATQGMFQARAKAGQGEEVDSPQFVFMFPVPTHEDNAIEGIASVLGPKTPVLGGSSACEVLETGEFVPWQFSSGGCGNYGISMALCWPSVHVAAAFCSGFVPKQNCQGTVTKVGHQYHLLEIDGKPARDVVLEWSGLREQWEQGKQMTLNPEDMEFQQQCALNGMIAVEVGTDQDGEPVYRNNIVLNYTRPPEEGLVMMTPVAEGMKLSCMWSTKTNLIKRTAKVAKQLLRASGFQVDEVRGALCIMCGENVIVGGPDSMQELCEELSSAVGYAPCMGLCTFGEQGMVGNGTSCSGCLMYSTVIFTTKKVDNVMTPGRNYKSLKNIQSMLLSDQGVVRETEDEE